MTTNLGTLDNVTRDVSVADEIVIHRIDNKSQVSIRTPCGSVTIEEKINEHSHVTIRCPTGNVIIGQKIDTRSFADIWAAGDVYIGQKIDQYSEVTIVAGGSVTLGEGIDQKAEVTITAGKDIVIGQAIDGQCKATLIAGGAIRVGEKVSGQAQVLYEAPSVNWGTEGVKNGASVAPIDKLDVVHFKGKADLYTAQRGNSSREIDATVKVIGAGSTRRTSLASFPNFDIGAVTISAEANGEGTVDTSSGEMTLPITVRGHADIGVDVASQATLTTKPGPPPGDQAKPIGGDGSVVLTAAGSFDAPFVGHIDYTLNLVGRFSDLPWVPHTNTWSKIQGAARDIAVGASGAAWVIGNNPVGEGNFGIHRSTGCGWSMIDGGGVRIAVDPKGEPWVVNAHHQIFRRVGNTWVQLPGAGTDIGIGADGSVWLVGVHPVENGDLRIHHWNGSGWTAVPGGAIRIAVGPHGEPWIVNSQQQVFHRVRGRWFKVPGTAHDVGVGADGSVWSVGSTYDVQRWNGIGWTKIEGSGVAISVGPDGLPWMIGLVDSAIYRRVPVGP
jgi:hypothetical protein